MARTVPLTQARNELSEILDKLESRHEHVVITRNGREVAALLPVREYIALQETLEVLGDPDLVAELEGRDQEEVYDWDAVRQDLGLA